MEFFWMSIAFKNVYEYLPTYYRKKSPNKTLSNNNCFIWYYQRYEILIGIKTQIIYRKFLR